MSLEDFSNFSIFFFQSSQIEEVGGERSGCGEGRGLPATPPTPQQSGVGGRPAFFFDR